MAKLKKIKRRRSEMYDQSMKYSRIQEYNYYKDLYEKQQQLVAEQARTIQEASDIAKEEIGAEELETYTPVEQNRREEEITNVVDDELVRQDEDTISGPVLPNITVQGSVGKQKDRFKAAKQLLTRYAYNVGSLYLDSRNRYSDLTKEMVKAVTDLYATDPESYKFVRNYQEHNNNAWFADFASGLISSITPGPSEHRDATKKRIRDWMVDFAADLGIDKNKTEIQTATGNIELSREKQNYLALYNQFLNNAQAIQSISERIKNTNDPEEKLRLADQINVLEKSNDTLLPYIEEASTYEYDSPREVSNTYVNQYGYQFDTYRDIDNISSDMKSAINAYKYYRNSENVDYSLFKDVKQLRARINKFNDYINKTVIPDALQSIKEDRQDLAEWRDWHVPSEHYTKMKEKASSDFKFLDINTYLYGLSGLIGSSSANNGFQLGSQVTRMIGGALLQTKNPAAMVAGGALEGVGTGLGFLSAETENQAEVAGAFEESFRANLIRNKLYDEFMDDYKKQTGEKGDFGDAIIAMMSNKYDPQNVKINEIASNSLWGANNFFQDDMVATYGSELFDTGISMFVPMSSKASGSLLKLGGKHSIGARLRAFGIKHPGARMFTNYASRVLSNEAGYIAGATINPAIGAATAMVGSAIGQARKYVFSPVARALSKKITFLSNWALKNPAAYMAKSNLAKKGLAFIGTEMGIGFSEAIEEGKQHIHAEEFKRGDYKGDSNDLFESIANDIEAGSRAAYTFIGDQFFGLNSDPELTAEMRAGFLGPFTDAKIMLPVLTQFGEMRNQYKADQIVANNVLAMKLKDALTIQNAIAYSKAAYSPNKQRAMEASFDKMKEIHSRLLGQGQALFTPEEVEQQRSEFRRIVELSKDENMKKAAENRGIKVGSDKYHTLVALYNYGEQLSKEAVNGLGEVQLHIDELWNNIGLSREEFDKAVSGGESISELNDQLVQAGLRQYIDMSDIHIMDGEDEDHFGDRLRNTYLERAKKVLFGRRAYISNVAELHSLLELIDQLENVENPTEALKDELKNYKKALYDYRKGVNEQDNLRFGFAKLDNIQDVKALVLDEESHNLLKDLYRQSYKYQYDLKKASEFMEDLIGSENNQMPLLDNNKLQSVISKIYNDVKASRENTKKANKEVGKSNGETEAIIKRYENTIKEDTEYILHIHDYYKDLFDKLLEEERKAQEAEQAALNSQEAQNIREEGKEGGPITVGEGETEQPQSELKAQAVGNTELKVGDRIKYNGEDFEITYSGKGSFDDKDYVHIDKIDPETNKPMPTTGITLDDPNHFVFTIQEFEKYIEDQKQLQLEQQRKEQKKTPYVSPQALIRERKKQYEQPTVEIKKNPTVPPIPPTPPTPPAILTGSTPEQQSTVQTVLQKIAVDKGKISHTGRDYFILENGKLVRYNRVHSMMEEQFPEKKSVLKAIEDNKTALRAVFSDKEAYKASIIELQKKYNDTLKELFGDSHVYEDQKIDLSLYYHEDIIDDIDAIDSIAVLAAVGERQFQGKTIKEIHIPYRSVKGGTIVDAILRDVFNGKEVIYDELFGMPRNVFDKLIADAKARKAQYEQDGYVLISEPINWHTTLTVNGKQVRVAGETDMIAIDKNGTIKIVDFKTSKRSFYQLLYKSPMGLWFNVRPGEEVPEGAETQIICPALDYKSPSANTTSRKQYTQQQTFYAKLIQKELAENEITVTAVELLPAYVRIQQGINPVTNQPSYAIFGGFASNTERIEGEENPIGGKPALAADYIELLNPVPLELVDATNNGMIDTIDKPEPVSLENAEDLMDELQEHFNTLQSLCSANREKLNRLVDQQIQSQILSLSSRLQNLRDNPEERTNPGTVESFESSIKQLIATIDNTRDNVSKEIAEYDARIASEEAAHQNEEQRFFPHERMYGNGHMRFNILNNMQMPTELKFAACNPDFATSAVVELNVKRYIETRGSQKVGTPNVSVDITYGGLTWRNITITLRSKDDQGNDMQRTDSELVQAIDRLLYTLDPDTKKPTLVKDAKKMKIVLTDMVRTNGKTEYKGTNDLTNVKDKFDFSEEELENLTEGTEKGILGIVKRGIVSKILKNVSNIKGIHGVDPDRALVNGMVVFEMNMNYEEDGSDKFKHSVPIILTPKTFHSSDIDLIIDCLKNYNGKRKITIDGKEYDSPLSNIDIIHTLVRFGSGSEATGNDFVFRFANVDKDRRPIDFKSVIITGVDKPLNVDDDGDMQILRERLSKLSVYYNNEIGMLHNLASNRDNTESNRYKGIEQFFRSFNGENGRAKIDQVKLSESMVFDRKDVDPDGDGSYKGITGVHWMINHGWISTNYSYIHNPLVSFSSAQIVNQQLEQEQQLMSAETNDPIDQEVTGATIIEGGSVASFREEVDDYLDDDDPMLDKRVPYDKPVTDLNEEKAKKRLHRILGNKIPVEIVDGLIDVSKRGGWKTLGRVKNAAIYLSKYAGGGVEFHEAFHAVLELLVSEGLRNRIYDHYRRKYSNGRKLTDRLITESLADMYMDFNNTIANSFGIVGTIKGWFDAIRSLADWRLARFFIATNLGQFKLFGRVTQDKIDRFNKQFKFLDYSIKDKQGNNVKFENLHNTKQFNEAVLYLVYEIMVYEGIDNLGMNLDKLDTRLSYIKSHLYANKEERLAAAKAKKEGKEYATPTEGFNERIGEGLTEEEFKKKTPRQQRDILIMRELINNYDAVRPFIIEQLNEMGIKSRRERDKKRKEDVDGGTSPSAISEDITGHDDEFFAHSREDDVDASIRLFLSTIPALRYATEEDVRAGRLDHAGRPLEGITRINANGVEVRNLVPMRVNSLGYTTFLDFKDVYQRLLKLMHDVKDVNDLNIRLQKAAQNDYVMQKIAKSFYNFRFKSYIRYNNKEYKNIPKVVYKGQLLDPKMYIRDVEHPSESELFMTSVIATKDYYDGDELICKEGEIIPGATIITNPDFESITTLLFLAIKSQKLDFTFCYDSPAINEQTGEDIPGSHRYNINSTNSEQSQRNYPYTWFDNIKSLYGSVFSGDNRLITAFKEAATLLRKLQAAISGGENSRRKITIDGRIYDLYNNSDFEKIQYYFIQTLNSVGIMIDRAVLNYMMLQAYPDAEIPQEAFAEIFTSSKKENSIWPFIKEGGVLDKIQKAFDDLDYDVIFNNIGSIKDKQDASGANLYAENAFVKNLSLWYGRYRTASLEMMTIGPENTKLYTFAQNHTISDFVFDLKQSAVDKEGNVSGSEILKDLKDVPYISYTTNTNQRIGSIVVKKLMDPSFNRSGIQLHTYGGLKSFSSHDGGTKYVNVTAREDYLGKAEILASGGIIFPTLSDKSTWFYITGIKLPGFDWNNRSNITENKLPFFGLGSGIMLFDEHDTRDNINTNDQLDQLIEYAYCDFRSAMTVLDQLKNNQIDPNHKVKNFHTGDQHGARLGFLLGVYDNKGKYVSFNNNKSTPELNLLKAYKYFFELHDGETEDQLRARQRFMMAQILEHRLSEEMDKLVEKGVIEYDENQCYIFEKNERQELKPTGKKTPKYFGYKNKYLDQEKIQYLKNLYKNRSFTKKYTDAQLESLAIVAYVNDINAKSNISLQETQRIFTGMPHFFKWKYDKNTGNLVDIGSDESKRYGGAGSTGTNNREDLPNIETDYVCAEIKDWEIASPLLNHLSESFRDNEYRDALAQVLIKHGWDEQEAYDAVYNQYADIDSIQEAIIRFEGNSDTIKIVEDLCKAESDSFKDGINVADGTAFITDKMAENLLRQRGKFTKNVAEAFDYLRGDRKVVYLKDGKKYIGSYFKDYNAYKTIHDALLSTQKYSAFGYRMEYGIPVHYYNKFALFPVFKGMSYGFTYDLYEKMQEDGVDMVMFDSAVKSGSEGAQEFNPDTFSREEGDGKPSIDSFSFKGHTYKQKYKFIRRQLNTDPRTEEEMSMGTQAGKIVMSSLRDGQTYVTDSGLKLTGQEIKDRIMSTLNKLSANGVLRIQKQFLNDDGTLNVEKFHNFIKGELMQRNADKNILDAIELEYDYDENGNPIDGSVHFRSPLNAVSNMQWIESILVSKINSEVIDVNMPGNAYYQRSVFGMEGNPHKIMSEDKLKRYQINGGKPLQMVNEEGSMDAVISIDYFLHLVPANIRYNFDKARQWLIDNEIIGPNAKANTMAYRIPTQAASSIHALRFVDVLPIMRDTIVLPKEFTKITGSDFDIDKLYLNTYNYTVKDGKASKDVDSEDQRLQNELLDMYMTLLKDAGKQIDGEWTMGKYMQILHRPIDNDTQLIENVLHTIEGKDNSRTEETMMFGSLNTQVDIKNSFITGKMGIGPFALNNNGQILTQLYHVAFKNKPGDILTELNATRLDNYRDRDGKSIMSWLSALINAHVDVAKDPYILRLNVNKYTWNIVNLLVRTGFGKDSFYFINQPIFKKLALEYENANGDIVEDPGMSPTERTRAAIRKYMMGIDFGRENNDMVDAMTDENTSIEDINAINAANMDIYKELFNIDKDGNYKGGKSLLEDLITNPKYRKDPSKPVSMENLSTEPLIKIGDNRFSPLELQMYAFFAKQQFDVHAQELSDVVLYTKIDTKKHGISRQEQRDYMARYNSIYRSAQDGSGPFNGGLYRMLSESFIDTKTRNAISLLLDILGKEMIHYTPTFEKGVQMICDEVNSQRAVTKKEASKALYTYIKQKCMNVYMRENGISFRDMITGDNSLASRIIALKAKMMTDNTGKYSEFVTNGIMTNNLLANLSRVHYNAPYGYEQYDVLTLENAEQDDNEIKDGYIDDWLQLWEFEDEEVRQIAHDLAIYAFMTSGDNAGFTKFFKYVPLDIREYIGYTQYMEDMKNAFMDGNITFNEDVPYGMFNIDIDEILRNNWKNNNLIPVTNLWRESRSGRKQLSAIGKYLEYDEVKDGETLNRKDVFKIFAGQYGAISKCRTTGEFPKFIKIRRPKTNKLSADQYILYKLIGTGKTTFIGKDKKQHMVTYPVYGLTYPKGFDVYSGSQRYTFYENDRRDGYKHLFDENYATSPEYLNAMWRAILNFLSFIDENTDVVQESAIKAMLDDTNTDIFSEEMKEFYQDSTLKQIIRDIYRYGGLPTDAESYDNVNEAYEIGRTADIDKETGSVGYYDEPGINDLERFNEPEVDKKVISSNSTILSNEELAIWNEAGVGPMPRILVASERTDPAFHVEQILNILDGKESVQEWGVSNGKRAVVGNLTGKDFAGLYLITKHDGLPMERLLLTKIPKLIHFSITGLGGTKYEPGVMKPDDLLDRIGDYIKMGLDPNTVTVRIDPIIPGVTTPNMIRNIVKRASEMGIKRIRFSIMDAYPNTVESLSKLGYDFERNYGTNQATGKANFSAKPEIINKIADFMLQLKDEYGVTLGTCAESLVRDGISKEGCLSVDAVNRMLGTSIPDRGTDNNTQRVLCSCYGGKVDALKYNASCASHCVYCYAKHENDKALQYYNEDGTLKDTVYTRTSVRLQTQENINLPGPETKINIYAGTGENADLSNFAERPFVFDFLGENIQLKSVEHGFQLSKLYEMYDELDEDKFESLKQLILNGTAANARSIGNSGFKMSHSAIDHWDEISSSVTHDLIKASFEQNPQALQRLLATGNATLTHTQDKGKWGTEFPRLLMEVRDELRAENNQLNDFNDETEARKEFIRGGKLALESLKTAIDDKIIKKYGSSPDPEIAEIIGKINNQLNKIATDFNDENEFPTDEMNHCKH